MARVETRALSGFAKNIEGWKIEVHHSRMRLQSACQKKDKNNHYYQTQAAAWVIAPTSAVGPSGQRAEKQQHQDNQENG
jgi:hypothetical protein